MSAITEPTAVAHTTIRNQKLFCTNCGEERAFPTPMELGSLTRIIDAFNKRHADCKPEWKQPMPDPGLTLAKKVDFWLKYGERGRSSETMFQLFSGQRINNETYPHHPLDVDDFRRCWLLIKMIPEWKEKIPTLAKLSPAWKNLAQEWDTLTTLLEVWKNGDRKVGEKLAEHIRACIL